MKDKQIKVCSLLPGATRTIQDLGLEDYLCGVTFECPSDKPKVVRSYIEGNNFSSLEIDRVVSKSKSLGKSLYYIDQKLLEEISPDIIFTQEVCDVCQIDTSIVSRAVYKLKKQPKIIPLVPRSLEDVYENTVTIAKAMGEEENAHVLLEKIKMRTNKVLSILRENSAPLKRVMVMEWIKPIYNCGHWIPNQIAIAGGVDMLSNPFGYSVVTSWEKVKKYNPEILVIAPCGFNIERTIKEISKLTELEGFNQLLAVKNNSLFIADAKYFTCPSTQLIDGIELLASLFHPKIFRKDPKFKNDCINFSDINKYYYENWQN